MHAPGARGGGRGPGPPHRPRLWPNPGLRSTRPKPLMARTPRTEAEARATPRPAAPKGVTVTTQRGQRVSLERGANTHHKKNPGKRPKSGG